MASDLTPDVYIINTPSPFLSTLPLANPNKRRRTPSTSRGAKATILFSSSKVTKATRPKGRRGSLSASTISPPSLREDSLSPSLDV